MKYLRPMVCCSAAIYILATSFPLLAADAKVPVYQLPTRGAPAGRVGGGTRGDKNVFVLSVLAPDHSALTTSEQPSLYWFISNLDVAADRTDRDRLQRHPADPGNTASCPC